MTIDMKNFRPRDVGLVLGGVIPLAYWPASTLGALGGAAEAGWLFWAQMALSWAVFAVAVIPGSIAKREEGLDLTADLAVTTAWAASAQIIGYVAGAGAAFLF